MDLSSRFFGGLRGKQVDQGNVRSAPFPCWFRGINGPRLGCERTAVIAEKAPREDKSLKAAARERGFLGADGFDALVRPETT